MVDRKVAVNVIPPYEYKVFGRANSGSITRHFVMRNAMLIVEWWEAIANTHRSARVTHLDNGCNTTTTAMLYTMSTQKLQVATRDDSDTYFLTHQGHKRVKTSRFPLLLN